MIHHSLWSLFKLETDDLHWRDAEFLKKCSDGNSFCQFYLAQVDKNFPIHPSIPQPNKEKEQLRIFKIIYNFAMDASHIDEVELSNAFRSQIYCIISTHTMFHQMQIQHICSSSKNVIHKISALLKKYTEQKEDEFSKICKSLHLNDGSFVKNIENDPDVLCKRLKMKKILKISQFDFADEQSKEILRYFYAIAVGKLVKNEDEDEYVELLQRFKLSECNPMYAVKIDKINK